MRKQCGSASVPFGSRMVYPGCEFREDQYINEKPVLHWKMQHRFYPIRSLIFYNECGEGGIRTPGASQLNGFQDRRNRPLCHLSGHKSSLFLIPGKTPACFLLK